MGRKPLKYARLLIELLKKTRDKLNEWAKKILAGCSIDLCNSSHYLNQAASHIFYGINASKRPLTGDGAASVTKYNSTIKEKVSR